MKLEKIFPKDKELLTKILTESFNFDTRRYFGKDAEGGPPGYNDGSLAEKILQNQRCHSYFVKVHHEVIGFISMDIFAREVRYFCLLPKYIGQGYGTKIWQMVENIYGKDGWFLETPDYSVTNHYFYEKLGFKKVGEKPYTKEDSSFIFQKVNGGKLNFPTVRKLIAENEEFLEMLHIVETLQLKDAWVAAGTLRNFLWNSLLETPVLDHENDVDVVFFDPATSYEKTMLIEKKLKENYPKFNWEVRNQVDMHKHNPNTPPYFSTGDAISKYPERCTAVGVRLNNEKIELFAPYGFSDISEFLISPTPHFLADEKRRAVYNQRVKEKNWQKKYPIHIQWA